MKKSCVLLFVAGVCVSTLIMLNTYLLILVLWVAPALLINNLSYLPHHKAMLGYLLTGNSTNLQLLLPADQYAHIIDVKNLLNLTALIVLVFAYFSYSTIRKSRSLFQQSAKLGILIFTITAALAITLFEQFFIFFHQLLFPQGNWSFPQQSILIQLYPLQFWQTMFGIIFLLTLLELIIISATIRKE